MFSTAVLYCHALGNLSFLDIDSLNTQLLPSRRMAGWEWEEESPTPRERSSFFTVDSQGNDGELRGHIIHD